jgi:hypothetical protein
MHYRNRSGWLAIGRRRSAGWLLAGWLAFWLTTAVAPCCRSLAAESGPDGALTVLQVAESTAHASDSDVNPQSSDFDCQDLTAVGPGAPPAAMIAGADRLDLVAVSVSADPHSSAGVRPLPATISWYHPPPGAPLYLRTLRLRI